MTISTFTTEPHQILKKPLELSACIACDIESRQNIIVTAGSSVTIQHELLVEHANALTVHCDLQERAELIFALRAHEQKGAREITFSAYLARDAQLKVFLFVDNCASMTIELNLHCEHPGAHVQVKSGARLCNNQSYVLRTYQKHAAPQTTSSLLHKVVLLEGAQSNHHGRIDITSEGQYADAQLYSKALVIGSRTQALAKPELEVQAHQVRCAHGSAVGKPDPEAMLYTQSRGLAKIDAEQILVEGFLSDVILV